MLEKINEVYNIVKDTAGFTSESPSPRVAKYLRQWAGEWNCSSELINFALEEANKVLTDANKLLKKWANSGITTPEEVKIQQKKSLPKEVKKSYDTEKVGRNSVLDWAKRYAAEEENE